MAKILPVVGDWYRGPAAAIFEVVAIDEDDRTIEIQHFDGTVEEFDRDTWNELLLEPMAAPEDWSGSMDIEREDCRLDSDSLPENNWNDALDFLDQVE